MGYRVSESRFHLEEREVRHLDSADARVKELLMSWSFMITDVVKNLQFCVRFQWP